MALNDHTLIASGEEAAGAPPSVAVLLSVATAAQMLGIGRTKAYELIDAGQLELVHIGRSALVPTESVHDFVRRLRAQASPPSPPNGHTGVVQLRSSPSDDSQPPAA